MRGSCAYPVSADEGKTAPEKAVLRAGGVISVQVLNELANVARRKMGLEWADTADFLGAVRGLVTVQPVTVETHEAGLALAERYGFSVYDAMIVAAALGGGVRDGLLRGHAGWDGVGGGGSGGESVSGASVGRMR